MNGKRAAAEREAQWLGMLMVLERDRCLNRRGKRKLARAIRQHFEAGK